ncbi:MAG: pyruvate:ferredoxin (flavodoxin) oxidoreductase, partial [Eubacteriales bacterium]|nr:pyruvate:ferredoxin (flavodoxin) oxidoreductase [Eubacteriales bacterium]
MSKEKRTMDGNEAAAYVSYAFTEVAAIYPITPSSSMAELVDEWSAKGKKNLFDQPVKLVEMQSEAGAAAAMFGSLEAGTLTTSYTASQGLALMIPTMYRIAGQLLPGVLHVSSRTLGTHAVSIYGDHSDAMACRQTGFAMLSTGSVQEVMDLSGVAHLAAIEGRVPFLHFFDGFRTSHEVQKVDVMDYKELEAMLDKDALNNYKKSSLNPERPEMHGIGQNQDVYFQNKEASNVYYDNLPKIVENYMEKINRVTGRNYKLFNYYGAEDAEQIIIAMGSVSGVTMETIDYLNAQGEKTGLLQVHLYRPFSIEHFLKEIPETVKRIAVLDRTKEMGAMGDPLYLDVCAAYSNTANAPEIYAGIYGLAGKDVDHAQIVSVYDNLKQDEPKNHFTVGIVDDVTFNSLPVRNDIVINNPKIINCKFWGLGSDGT